MPKERRVLAVSSSRPRLSPYPLRSSRNDSKKQKGPESPLQSEGSEQWEDVSCVICMEPPHNAVLLHCSSFSNGCRPYMCDTTARHSNCFKQYRRSNAKSLNCPLCRGEVYGTMKVTSARRFMNAKPRSCSIEECDFSGTYSQLKNHLKTEHLGFKTPKVDPWKQLMEAETDYFYFLRAVEIQRQRWMAEASALRWLPYSHSVFQMSFGGFMEDPYGSSVVGTVSTAHSEAAPALCRGSNAPPN
ncbi:PREDICTED: uncharacterized protein LOC104812494 [Tarenaya hassleriana]|uniref:uncharacterized protein LOC104812494 n=1 Tax=Tarenaya hassleriana TaxID=28532 RepID=UPI00053C7B48|nr:PREDICTED: uncharacterized protein LOC104812494 [Tarenaya hassleriana]XP_010537976.1 PREDICTED: uncharacterized protein LOC104812494 [Tarenaya hassleriana]